MKKILIITIMVLVIIGLALLYVYKTQNTDATTQSKESTQPVTNNVMTGKIVEVVDADEILIEITKERGKLFLGDLVKVQYKAYLINELNIKEEPECDDIVSVVYAQEYLKETDTEEIQYNIEASKVYEIITDNIVKIKVTEIVDESTVRGKVTDEDYEDDSELEITYKEFVVSVKEENGYEETKGKVSVGDEVLIQYTDDNITQKENKVIVDCERMVK